MRGDLVGALYAEALRTPFDRIVEATGLVPGAVADDLRSSVAGAGFDQRTGRIVTDPASEGLVDSLPIVSGALRTASSIAKQVVKVNCAVVCND
jgi:chaperonin GroEL (HSP60 family)